MAVVFSRFHRSTATVYVNVVSAKDALAGAVRTQSAVYAGILGRWQSASAALLHRYGVAPEIVVSHLFFTQQAGITNGHVLVGTSGAGNGRIARVTGVMTRETFGLRIGTFYVVLCEEIKA